MDFATSTVSGVVGGLIATAICVAIRQWWIRIYWPWHEERFYKGARIDGRWKSECKIEGEVREGIWELRQIGHSVTGTLTEVSEGHHGAIYTFTGVLKNLILTGEYSALARHSLDRGTFTLMLSNDGTRLIGAMAYYSNKKSKVDSVDYECIIVGGEVSAAAPRQKAPE